MRQYPSGATRDDAEDKLSYFKALSPMVLRRYVQYMGQHRKQADGQMRDWDNWKSGIPQEDYLDSLIRHVMELWSGFQQETIVSKHELEDLLCAIIFNAMGCLYEELLYDYVEEDETESAK